VNPCPKPYTLNTRASDPVTSPCHLAGVVRRSCGPVQTVHAGRDHREKLCRARAQGKPRTL